LNVCSPLGFADGLTFVSDNVIASPAVPLPPYHFEARALKKVNPVTLNYRWEWQSTYSASIDDLNISRYFDRGGTQHFCDWNINWSLDILWIALWISCN
jgi:hypothetical protein